VSAGHVGGCGADVVLVGMFCSKHAGSEVRGQGSLPHHISTVLTPCLLGRVRDVRVRLVAKTSPVIGVSNAYAWGVLLSPCTRGLLREETGVMLMLEPMREMRMV